MFGEVSVVVFLVTILIVAILVALVSVLITYFVYKNNIKSKIGNAEEKAREILDEALKTAEAKKREGLLEIKEESIKYKNEIEKENKERRAELQRSERRVQQKEESVDKKLEQIERKEAAISSKEAELAKEKESVSKLNEQRLKELERISGYTSEEAKEYLLRIVEEDLKHEKAVRIKEMESQIKEDSAQKIGRAHV